MVKAGIGESGSVRRKSSRFENRADEPVLVTIKVDVLVSTSLEFLDIPFFFIGLLMRAQNSGYRS